LRNTSDSKRTTKNTADVAGEPTRLLVVDDSALYRQTIVNALRDTPDVSIVGVARDGRDAIEKVEELDPDLLTLDVQMPGMDGIAVLREINRRRLRAKAIMVSSLTKEGAQVTTDALLEGAFDFILKPSGRDPNQNRLVLRENLDKKIAAFRGSDRGTKLQERRLTSVQKAAPSTVAPTGCRAVIIGVSTGGPAALKRVLPSLPATLPVPVLVVQHMPSQFTQALARRLDDICTLCVSEATNGTEVRAGRVLVAPGGRHMKLVRHAEQVRVKLTNDPPENGVRPSVDYLLRSAGEVFQGQALGVIMTGMGRDGLEGCRDLKARGGRVFAQHPFGCVVYGMPKALIDNDIADRVLPLSRMGSAIVSHLERSRRE
jgi:two-component system chemotaxis response regulator CheB